MARIFVVVNEKGGVGKTTFTTNAAVYLSKLGKSVVIVNLDENVGLLEWNKKRGEDSVALTSCDKNLKQLLRSINDVFDYVVIDCAPEVSNTMADAIIHSHLAIIPVQPSPFDVYDSDKIVQLITARIDKSKDNFKAAFVISRDIANSKLSKSIESKLSPYGIPVLENRIRQKVVYANVVEEGKTVVELGEKNPARKEFELVMQEILSL